jgi:hypothetical protein
MIEPAMRPAAAVERLCLVDGNRVPVRARTVGNPAVPAEACAAPTFGWPCGKT